MEEFRKLVFFRNKKTYLGLVSVQYSGSNVSPSTELTSASFVNFILAYIPLALYFFLLLVEFSFVGF